MKSPPGSWILIFLSFIFFLDITMSDNSPHHPKYEVGQSASISCSVPPDRDIRELSFYKGAAIIFTLWIKDGRLSNELQVSGTYNDFTWTLNQDNGETFKCINGNSVGSPTLGCSHPDHNASIIELSDGSGKMASLLIDSNYKSRIQVSGTIRNSTITLTGLTKKDEGCYACRWKELNVPELNEGVETCPTVEKPTWISTRAIIVIVLATVLLLLIIFGVLIVVYKKSKKTKAISEVCSLRPVPSL